jgi:hypothetical protein
MLEALGIQHAMCIHHIVIYGFPGSKIIYRIILQTAQKLIGHELSALNLSTTFVGNISHSKTHWARYDQQNLLVFM